MAKAAPPADLWLGGGFASIIQNETMMKVNVDYSNVTKVLAIVGEAVKETKQFEKVIQKFPKPIIQFD